MSLRVSLCRRKPCCFGLIVARVVRTPPEVAETTEFPMSSTGGRLCAVLDTMSHVGLTPSLTAALASALPLDNCPNSLRCHCATHADPR